MNKGISTNRLGESSADCLAVAGLVCADRREAGRPGHITVVVPETVVHTAVRDAAGNVSQPLQSQAGSTNKRYGSAGVNWWLGAQFTGHVFYVHD